MCLCANEFKLSEDVLVAICELEEGHPDEHAARVIINEHLWHVAWQDDGPIE